MRDAIRLVPAEAASARLGVSRQTLYAYVSRGLIRAEAAPGDPRRSLYDVRDVARLVERRQAGRARRAIAGATTDFGEPILRSGLTRIADGRFSYRGQDAVVLSRTATLEATACLLWPCESWPDGAMPAVETPPDRPLARCLRAAAELASRSDYASRPEQVTAEAATLVRRITQAACGSAGEGSAHAQFAAAWGLDDDTTDLVRRALVLCADHELNASAYAARVVASTGASLAACVAAGLAALSGPRHGGMTDRVRAMAAEPDLAADPRQALSARLARGDAVPGFGHRLYPDVDPRAVELLGLLRPDAKWTGLIRAASDLTGLAPTLDVALAALEDQRELPPGGGLAVFATGRCVGWIAHALEQRADGRLIRPRAEVG